MFERAQEGARAHRRIQKSRGQFYQPEVLLKMDYRVDQILYQLSGRADGIIQDYKDGALLEEIKTTWGRKHGQPEPVDLAQAKLYAAMLAFANNHDRVWVRLTYFDLENQEAIEHETLCHREDLIRFLKDSLESYDFWQQRQFQHLQIRDDFLQKLVFPFPYRQGQRDLSAQIFRAIKNNHSLYLMAPTGMGKTLAVLFSGLKTLMQRHADRIAYLTAKSTGKSEVEKTCILLTEKGARFRYLTLTAKEKICINPEIFCETHVCLYATNFFDNLTACLKEALDPELRHMGFTQQTLVELAKKHSLCPYYLSTELIPWMDLVVGDYNYAFDPNIQTGHLLGDTSKKTALLVDEAHNLPDRARAMYSSSLTKNQILKFRKVLRLEFPKLGRQLSRLNRQFLEAKNEMEHLGASQHVKIHPPETFTKDLERSLKLLEQSLALEGRRIKPVQTGSPLVELYFLLLQIRQTLESYDETYVTLWEKKENDIELTLYCVHPGRKIAHFAQKAQGQVFFSATLHPLSFFKRELGGNDDEPGLVYPSPFPRNHLLLMVAPYFSTRFGDRKKNIPVLLETIHAALSPKIGNYLIFFPSFEYLAMVWEDFSWPGATLLKQERNTTEQKRLQFLECFNENPKQHHIGFCVMGGVFSEGIDLAGSRLDGVIIVGVGLPPRSLKADQIQQYQHANGQNGYAFAYLYPGWIRVLQSAGRVIRSENDKGFVLLAGDRFSSDDYRPLFPAQWVPPIVVNRVEQVKQEISFFWS